MRPLPRTARLPLLLLALSCTMSDDPGQGGFLAGVSGLSSGAYDERLDAREAAVERAQRRQATLRAEIAIARRELAGARAELSRRRAAAAAAGTPVPAELARRIDAVLARPMAGAGDRDRLARYRNSISESRRLAERLARL